MGNVGHSSTRIFKTAWFAKAARKAGIADRELCAAIREAMRGQADDLGGIRALAKDYAGLTQAQMEELLQDRDLTEICNGD